jgi:hypothetical protein
MNAIQPSELPQEALLARYKQEGAYTDCYSVAVPHVISHAEYVEAFYTTALFKTERLILRLLVSKPSTDLQAMQLAGGEATAFSAWNVEGRAKNQLLLCDFLGHTRSWLMTSAIDDGNLTGTRFYFGSAVVPKINAVSGQATFGVAFHALQRFHIAYSKALLRSAASRLLRAKEGANADA